jgi:HAMP domain-containing protein
LTTAAVIALSARQSILEQMEEDGRLLTEQLARAIAVGEEIGQDLEALYAQQEEAEVVLAPLVLTLAQASGRSVEEIAAQLIEASGYAAFEDFAERRMGDAWLGQFINHLLGDNVSAMWIVGPALETRLYDAVPDAPIGATLSGADRDALQTARDARQTQTYHDGDFLRIAAPIVNSQGQVTGVALVALPAERMQQALNRQFGLTMLVAVLVLGAGLPAAIILSRRVTGPVAQLTTTAAAVEAGEFESGRLAAVAGRTDELGQLARVFENMAREVAARDRRLNSLRVVIPVGVSLSAEKDFGRLLETIMVEAQSLCNADSGALYLQTEDDWLKFVIVRNISMGIAEGGATGNAVTFPPLRLYDESTGEPNHHNVATHAALSHSWVNIPDAYQAEGFDFSGTQAFDATTGYRSTSFLTIPLEGDDGRVIGVLQLINAQDPETGAVVPFKHDEVIESLVLLASAGLAAYMREESLRQEIQELRIVVDTVKRTRQVEEITETDYFQQLQKRARDIREKR